MRNVESVARCLSTCLSREDLVERVRQREFEGFERRMDKGSKLAGRNKKLHLLTGIEAGFAAIED